jgi:hypothetical protein
MIEIEVEAKERDERRRTEKDYPEEPTLESLENCNFAVRVVCRVVHVDDDDASLKLR